MRQLALFAPSPVPRVLVDDHGDVQYFPGFLGRVEACKLYSELDRSTLFRADSRMMYGRRVLIPRETALRGDGCPQGWSPMLIRVRTELEVIAGISSDYVFINRYRSGNDSVAWHNDDDAERDPRRTIASLSLGTTRTFEIRPLRASGLAHRKIAIDLADGDLILMRGETQLHYEHRVPKEPRITGVRINLTFRQYGPSTRK